MRTHLHAHPRRIYTTTFRTSFGLQRYWPPHLHRSASYAVLVHHGSILPAASFRLRLAADALAVRLALPLVGRAGDLNPQVGAPCRAHEEERPPGLPVAFVARRCAAIVRSCCSVPGASPCQSVGLGHPRIGCKRWDCRPHHRSPAVWAVLCSSPRGSGPPLENPPRRGDL